MAPMNNRNRTAPNSQIRHKRTCIHYRPPSSNSNSSSHKRTCIHYVPPSSNSNSSRSSPSSNESSNDSHEFEDYRNLPPVSVNVNQGEIAAISRDPTLFDIDEENGIIEAVLEMDVPKKLVKKAVKRRQSENGQQFATVEELLEAVFSLESQVSEELGNMEDDTSSTGAIGALRATGATEASSAELDELNELKEQRRCKICLDHEVCITLVPCGHLVCCSSCAPSLRTCPICRKKIKSKVHTYMA